MPDIIPGNMTGERRGPAQMACAAPGASKKLGDSWASVLRGGSSTARPIRHDGSSCMICTPAYTSAHTKHSTKNTKK